MPEANLPKKLNAASNALTTSVFSAEGGTTTKISNLTVRSVLRTEPPLYLRKRKHKAHKDQTKASSNESHLLPYSPISQKYSGSSNDLSWNCRCENLACDCSNRLLNSVPQNLPVSITKLLLDRNYLESLNNNTFSRYRDLTVLDVSINYISSLQQGTFLGLDRLTWLDLSQNSIGSQGLLSQSVFKPLRSLKYLRMDVNNFKCTKNSSFLGALLSSLSNLQELHIDYFGEQYYDRGFNNLTSLQILRVYCGKHCPFIGIKNATFENLGQLKNLSISDCCLNGTEIEYDSLSHFTKLQTLDISRNPSIGLEHLPRVMYGLRHSSLQTLVMDNIVDKYSINFVKTYMIQHLPQTLTTLFARGNNIVYVDEQVMKTLPENLRKVDVSNNDIIMNPMTLPLADIRLLDTLVINNFDEECHTSVEDIFSSIGIVYNSKGRQWTRKAEFIYQKIMTSLRTLILQSNYIDFSLDPIGLNFIGLPNLTDLDLSLNQMKVLTKDLFYGIENLEYLRLNGNLFSDFVADISHLPKLKLLNLSNTELPCLSELVRTHIDQLAAARPGQIQVDMSGCPIQCDCFNQDFLKWMTNSPAFDKNFTGYKCRYLDTSIKHIGDGYKDALQLLTRQCAQNYPLYLVTVAGTLVISCLVIGMVLYRFRWKIRYFYYAAYLKVMDNEREEPNDQFLYDVFISYDSEDNAFVQRRLLPELEQRGLVLLVHGRDFVAGTSIPANIFRAVAESRRTLAVLTRSFVESYWCNFELQMATNEAVHTGREVLVFVIKENIPNRELDVELLGYIKNNTYLPYPSPEDEGDQELMKRFYDKLAHDLRS
ncbi:unnamed protein product [Candidula unifasciata]|uniref:TIR domain-containing protein n=2 Tax=Candidula unifasciata TaxID=100452 RepID=A0A8S3Z0N3_9EUPU|nr:unnamed protein product [Candidula unifasciata]